MAKGQPTILSRDRTVTRFRPGIQEAAQKHLIPNGNIVLEENHLEPLSAIAIKQLTTVLYRDLKVTEALYDEDVANIYVKGTMYTRGNTNPMVFALLD